MASRLCFRGLITPKASIRTLVNPLGLGAATKNAQAAYAKEVGMGNPSEET